jgi:hypothetical protein
MSAAPLVTTTTATSITWCDAITGVCGNFVSVRNGSLGSTELVAIRVSRSNANHCKKCKEEKFHVEDLHNFVVVWGFCVVGKWFVFCA